MKLTKGGKRIQNMVCGRNRKPIRRKHHAGGLHSGHASRLGRREYLHARYDHQRDAACCL